MTAAGHVVELNGARDIITVGRYPFDFWTDVAVFKHTELPSGFSAKPYTFVVTGVIGNPTWTHPHVPTHTVIEVGLGLSNGIGVLDIARMRIQADGFNALSTPNRGVPFMFVLDSATDASALGSGTVDLVLRARMDGRETFKLDPFLLTRANPRFQVMEATLHCWDRTVMSASSHFEEVAVNRLGAGHIGRPSGLDLLGSTTSWGSAAEKWLIYLSVIYHPASVASPKFSLVRERVGGGGSDTDFPHLGMQSIGRGIWFQGGDLALKQNHHWLGNFAATTFAAESFFRLYHEEQHTNSNGNVKGFFTYIDKFRVFGIRLSDLSSVHTYDPTNLANTPRFFSHVSPPRVSDSVCREMSNTLATRTVIMATTTRLAGNKTASPFPFALNIKSGTQYLRRGAQVESRPHTGVPNLLVATEDPFPPQQKTVCMETVRSPYIVFNTNVDWDSHSNNFIAYEMQTSFAPGYADEVKGPDVYLTPDGEADGTSLPTWPVAPSDSHSEVPDLPLESFRNPLGYRITWPRTLVPRDTRVWTWAALSQTDRETLETFIDDQAVAAIRYTRPGANDTSSRVYALIGRPTFTPMPGGLFSASMSGIELVYGTAITPRVLT